jgi:hypothetical protein
MPIKIKNNMATKKKAEPTAPKSGVRSNKSGQTPPKKEMIKRKDGSVSQRGLWDNVRANIGSGKKPTKSMLKEGKKITKDSPLKKTAAWTRKEGKSETGGLNAKGVASYRAANPGSKLQTAVTKKPSELKPGSKDAKRRKSFCARMPGMPGALKDEKGRPTRKKLALDKWNC